RAFGHLIADLDFDISNRAGAWRRHIHRRFVRFERDQRVFQLHVVAGFNENLDYRHVFVITNVGDFDLDHVAHLLQTVAGFGFSGSIPYFLIASLTFDAGTAFWSASAFSAATAT